MKRIVRMLIASGKGVGVPFFGHTVFNCIRMDSAEPDGLTVIREAD